MIDDIVPGHTGKGADFRLAEMAFKDYPGIYHMIEIPPEDWPLLPDVPEGRDASTWMPRPSTSWRELGYIIGELQRVIFYMPGVKETNWSATDAVIGVDGHTRRWVYLHYFKEGQPSINWLDPTFAGMRLVIGDALHSLGDLGTSALRLDANGFLGVERSAEGLPGWSEGHPLSHAANHVIAGMVRKVGGFTFQELNLAIEDIRDTGAVGADLSYDFVEPTRVSPRAGHPQHRVPAAGAAAVARGRRGAGEPRPRHAEPRRADVRARALGDAARRRCVLVPGHERSRARRSRRRSAPTSPSSSPGRPTSTGYSRRTASPARRRRVIAATQGFATLHEITEADVPAICDAHLLLAKYNAWQPGVFALSGWDLTGMLTVPPRRCAT